ncbi:MAG: acyl carrier protein [Bacteroidota bacterium]
MKHFDAEFESLFSETTTHNSEQPLNISSFDEVVDAFKELLLDIAQKPAEFFCPQKRLKEDYGLDSLDMVELVMYCEKDFSLVLRDHEWRSLRTPEQFLEMLSAKLMVAV